MDKLFIGNRKLLSHHYANTDTKSSKEILLYFFKYRTGKYFYELKQAVLIVT